MIDRRQRERQWQQPPNPWIPLDDVADGLYLEDDFSRNEDDIETELFQDGSKQIESDQENQVSWQVAQRGPPARRTTGRFRPARNVGERPLTLQTQIAVENLYRKLPFGSSVRVTREPRAGREIITFEAPPSRNSREERPLSSVPAFISDHNVRAEPLPRNATPVPRFLPQGRALMVFKNPQTGREDFDVEPIQSNKEPLEAEKQNSTIANRGFGSQFPPDPEECRQLENQMQRILFSNKRFPGSNTGDLGLLYRRAEQICGQHGPNDVPPGVDPDRTPWKNHSEEIQGRQVNLARVYKRYYEKLFCPNSEKRIDRNQIHRMQRKEFNPSPEEWLGPNHPNCKGLSELLRNNSNPTLPRFFNDF